MAKEDMSFAEGSYRVGGCDWCVFIASKRPVREPTRKAGTWASGVFGIVAEIPLGMALNMATIESLLAEVLGVGDWERVRGPDSMQLR
jgi:hypothetical protein